MIRKIEINKQPIKFEDMNTVVRIFPELEECFRKHKYDFLFNTKSIKLKAKKLDELTKEFKICLDRETLYIDL